MPIGAQPHRARGTIDHPYSALNLRLVLAGFGLVSCTVFSALAFRADYGAFGFILAVLAAVALVDLVIIQRRRRERHRREGRHPSLFE